MYMITDILSSQSVVGAMASANAPTMKVFDSLMCVSTSNIFERQIVFVYVCHCDLLA